MFEEQATKVKITSLVILVGMSAMLAAVVTDHWAVLSPRVEKLNATCEAAHFGLWRLCKKSIFIVEEDPLGKGCGPISLPGGMVLIHLSAALWVSGGSVLGSSTSVSYQSELDAWMLTKSYWGLKCLI